MRNRILYVRVEISVGIVDDVLVAGCYCNLRRMWWQAAREVKSWVSVSLSQPVLLLSKRIIKTHLSLKVLVLCPESFVHQPLLWSHPPSSSLFSSPRPWWRSWCARDNDEVLMSQKEELWAWEGRRCCYDWSGSIGVLAGEGRSWWICAELFGMLKKEKGTPFLLSWEELASIFSRVIQTPCLLSFPLSTDSWVFKIPYIFSNV